MRFVVLLAALLTSGPIFAASPRSGCDGGVQAVERLTGPDGGLAQVVYLGDVVLALRCVGDAPGTITERAERVLGQGAYVPVSGLLPGPRDEVRAAMAQACSGAAACADDFFVPAPVATDGGVLKGWGIGGGNGDTSSMPTIFKHFLGHAGLQGHYEFTLRAIDDLPPTMMLPPAVARAMADASRDADFYEWGTPAAHAQTENTPSGMLKITDDKARKAFAEWLKRRALRSITACKNKEDRAAIYWLGYLVHGVQDLAFHRGISNAEHAWRDYGPSNPEEGVDVRNRYVEKRDWAIGATRSVLERMHAVLTKHAPGCWERIAVSQLPLLTVDEKDRLQGKGPDMDLTELGMYVKLSFKIPDLQRQRIASTKYLAPRWLVNDDDPQKAIDLVLPAFAGL